ncbi:MAG: protein kinase, partial [Acidimicrobiales bacterium]
RLQLDDTLLRRHAHIIRTHARSVVDHHTPRESTNQLSSYQASALPIGISGFASMYRGVDPSLGTVAIKVLNEQWSADTEVRERFLHEARLMRALNDPGLVKIFDVGEHATDDGRPGAPCFVMELFEHGTLAERLLALGRPLTLAEGLTLAQAIAWCTGPLHRPRPGHPTGVVHRDLKPSNYLIREVVVQSHPPVGELLPPGFELVVGDLGLARDGQRRRHPPDPHPGNVGVECAGAVGR